MMENVSVALEVPLSVHLSHHMGKQTICIGETKDADQLRSNYEADQRLFSLLG